MKANSKKPFVKEAQNKNVRRAYFSAVLVLTLCVSLTVPALADGTDPLTVVTNLSNFIFSCIKAIGVIVLGWELCRSVCPSSPTTPASAHRAFFACSAV